MNYPVNKKQALGNTLRIGMAGPISTMALADLLNSPQEAATLPPGLGGTMVNHLIRELHSRGHEVTVFTLDPDVSQTVSAEGERIKILYGPFRPQRARDFFRHERSWLRATMVSEAPDLIHAHWAYEYALAARGSGLPYLISMRDAPLKVLKFNLAPYRIVRTLMAYRAVLGAKKVVANSPYIAEHLKRWMFYRKPVEIVPNGTPESLFSDCRQQKREQPAAVIATILSGWGPLKNGEAAIRCLALLHQRGKKARLIMFGEDYDNSGPAYQVACKLGVEKYIEFPGKLPFANLMRRLGEEVDVVLHPALEESFGNVLVEAMAKCIPVVGGENSGAVPWVLGEGRGGLLVDVSNPEAIAEALEQLLASEDMRGSLASAGHAWARSHFHITQIARSYETIYGNVLRHSR
jgi:glycosyltransferase involved in cell wall biosynthesis